MASSDRVTHEAFVTLATNDSYALGALVLARSLRRAGTTRQICVMVTNNISQQVREQLSNEFDHMENVDVMDSHDNINLTLLTRPDLGVTFTKLHCWRLTQYSKCVFMDADTLVRDNIDELFEREELSAVADVGWPDCFNSGVFVYRPSQDTYQALLAFAVSHGSFDGGDQGLLNLFFSDWATKDIARHLSFIYNCVSSTFYSYAPAVKQFGKNVKVIHFIGARKPWHYSYNTATGRVDSQGDAQSEAQIDALTLWWQIFMQDVQSSLQSQLPSSSADGGPQRCHVHLYHQEPPRPIQPHYTHTPYRPAPTMTSPYQPPAVETFYSPPPPQPHVENQAKETWRVVENKDDRDYGHQETFYVESPMTWKGEEVQQEVHDTHHFHETLSSFEPKPEPVVEESHHHGEGEGHHHHHGGHDYHEGHDHHPEGHHDEGHHHHGGPDYHEGHDHHHEGHSNEGHHHDGGHDYHKGHDHHHGGHQDKGHGESHHEHKGHEHHHGEHPPSEHHENHQHHDENHNKSSETAHKEQQHSQQSTEKHYDPQSFTKQHSDTSDRKSTKQHSKRDVGLARPHSVGEVSLPHMTHGFYGNGVRCKNYLIVPKKFLQNGKEVSSRSFGDLKVGIRDGVATVLPGRPSYSDAELADSRRQYNWEKGQIDYLGIDSFDNIKKKLDQTLSTKPEQAPVFPSPSTTKS